jgi:hypothetical protein
MRLLALSLVLLAAPALANWRPTGGMSAVVAPHIVFPATSLGDRNVGLGMGWHTDLSHWSSSGRQAFGLRLSVDGFPGDDLTGGDVFSMDLMAHGGVDIDLTRRWVLQGWGGAGWNRTDGPGDAVSQAVAGAGVRLQRRTRLRHILVGWEVAARWLGSASGLVLQTGPVVRWQR